MTTSRSPDIQGVESRTLRAYPGLNLVLSKHQNDFGAVRVFKKSLMEIEALRIALPDEYFESEWIDSDALPEGYRGNCHHFILWVKTKVDNLPPVAETIVIKVKEG